MAKLLFQIFSHPSRNRKHAAIAARPRKNIADIQILRFMEPPSNLCTTPLGGASAPPVGKALADE
jgi:hypothetical protein